VNKLGLLASAIALPALVLCVRRELSRSIDHKGNNMLELGEEILELWCRAEDGNLAVVGIRG
jgi:hypothetical protein